MIEFDPAKDAKNQTKHGLSLAAADDFDWNAAVMIEDDREDYGERRHRAIGSLSNGLVVAITFTIRAQNIRVISLRPASRKERNSWQPE